MLTVCGVSNEPPQVYYRTENKIKSSTVAKSNLNTFIKINSTKLPHDFFTNRKNTKIYSTHSQMCTPPTSRQKITFYASKKSHKKPLQNSSNLNFQPRFLKICSEDSSNHQSIVKNQRLKKYRIQNRQGFQQISNKQQEHLHKCLDMNITFSKSIKRNVQNSSFKRVQKNVEEFEFCDKFNINLEKIEAINQDWKRVLTNRKKLLTEQSRFQPISSRNSIQLRITTLPPIQNIPRF